MVDLDKQHERLSKQLELARMRRDLDEIKLRRQVIRAQKVALSTFQAADKGRTNRDWRAPRKTADQAIIPDMPTLNARARMALWDDWTVRSIVGAYCRGVVGIGITARSAAKDPATGNPLTEFNEGIDHLWRRWAQKRRWCDVARMRTFVEAERFAVQEWVLVGNAFARISYEPNRDTVGVRFQLFEAEQLDFNKTRNGQTGNEVRAGVEIDEFGGAVAYWVSINVHPWESGKGKSVRVPAEEIIHLWRPERARQTLGVTQLCASLQKSRHLSQYDIYQLVAARLEAASCGFYRRSGVAGIGATDYMSLPSRPGEEKTDAAGARYMEMEPGMMRELPPDVEDPKFFTPNRPGGQYDPFVNAQVDQIGAAAGVDGASVSRNFTRGTYSSQRQGMLENWKQFDPVELMVIDELGRPFRETFKRFAVLEGKVKAPGFFVDPELRAAYLEDNWQGPPKEWIDPLKMMMAAKLGVDYRLITREMVANERGLFGTDIMREFGEEIREAGRQGVSLPDVQAPAKPAGAAKPATAEERTEDGEEAPATGEKGTSALMAALEREIEREVMFDLIRS